MLDEFRLADHLSCFQWISTLDHRIYGLTDLLTVLYDTNSIYVGLVAINSSLDAIIDTGTTFIVGPTASIDTLNIALGGTYDPLTTMLQLNYCFDRYSLKHFILLALLDIGRVFSLPILFCF